MQYIKQIDGFRFIAIIGVLIAHYFGNEISGFPFGNGVNLFFVISGYLITKILIVEKSNPGFSVKKSLLNFYARRGLRIFPIYYGLIIFLYLIKFQNYKEVTSWMLCYGANIYASLNKPYLGSYNHLWSLSVEEQFYLLWPFFILCAKNPKSSGKIIYASIIISVLFKVALYLYNGWTPAINAFTLSCTDSLGLGALIAYFEIYRINKINYFIKKRFYFITGSAILFCFHLIFHVAPWVDVVFSNFLFSIFSFFILIPSTQDYYKGWFKRFIENKWVVHFGRISYGIYLYHLFMPDLYNYVCEMHLFEKQNNATRILFYFVAVICIAELSWFLIERPINFLKRKFKV